MIIVFIPFFFFLKLSPHISACLWERSSRTEIEGEYVFNLVWCLVLFFAFLRPVVCKLEFLASIKEVVGLVVIWLEHEMNPCTGSHLDLVYGNRAFTGKIIGFICKPLMRELTRGAKRHCFSLSHIIFSLWLHGNQCRIISAYLSIVLISSRSLIQFPFGPVWLCSVPWPH